MGDELKALDELLSEMCFIQAGYEIADAEDSRGLDKEMVACKKKIHALWNRRAPSPDGQDARRYRWLRDNGCSIFGESQGAKVGAGDGQTRVVQAPVIRATETLDAAIDAAIALEVK